MASLLCWRTGGAIGVVPLRFWREDLGLGSSKPLSQSVHEVPTPSEKYRHLRPYMTIAYRQGKNKKHPRIGVITRILGCFTGGAKGNRTPDLFIANEALYQLSYSP